MRFAGNRRISTRRLMAALSGAALISIVVLSVVTSATVFNSRPESDVVQRQGAILYFNAQGQFNSGVLYASTGACLVDRTGVVASSEDDEQNKALDSSALSAQAETFWREAHAKLGNAVQPTSADGRQVSVDLSDALKRAPQLTASVETLRSTFIKLCF